MTARLWKLCISVVVGDHPPCAAHPPPLPPTPTPNPAPFSPSVSNIAAARWFINVLGLLQAYVFSSENWKRPEQEVGSLLSLTERVLGEELAALGRQNVRLNFVGSQAGLPRSLLQVLHL